MFKKGIVVVMVVFVLGIASFAQAKPEKLSGKLTLWTFYTPFKTYYEKSVPLVIEAYPEVVDLNLEVTILGIPEIWDKLYTAFLSGEGIPDLVDVEIKHPGQFFGPDQPVYFADLTERFKTSPYYEDLVLARTAQYTFDGRTYAIDCDMSASFLYYRKDIFDRYGLTVPTTWEEYIEDGLKLKEQGIYMTQVSSGEQQRSGAQHLFQIMLQNNGKIFDKTGKLVVESPENEEALQLYVDMVNKHGIAMATYLSLNDPPFYAQLSEGKVATMVRPNWFLTFQFSNALPDQTGLWRAAHLPVFRQGGRRTSSLGGTGLFITKAAAERGNLELAWRFYEFNMLRKEGALLHNGVVGWFPPVKSVLSDPQLLRPIDYLGGQSLGKLFFEIVDEIPYCYTGPYFLEVWDIIRSELIYPTLSEGKTPKQALADMAKRIRRLMER